MTIEVFLALLLILSSANALLTQAVKKFLDGYEFKYSSNVVALIDSIIVGAVGTYVYYLLDNIPFDGQHIMFLILLTIATWISSMIGYDKILQLMNQIKDTNLK